jgi:hypothetical protein
MIYLLIYFVNCFLEDFLPRRTDAAHSSKISVFIAHNVPAVYDGLTARIKKCVAFLGLANCGCSEPWEWSVAE